MGVFMSTNKKWQYFQNPDDEETHSNSETSKADSSESVDDNIETYDQYLQRLLETKMMMQEKGEEVTPALEKAIAEAQEIISNRQESVNIRREIVDREEMIAEHYDTEHELSAKQEFFSYEHLCMAFEDQPDETVREETGQKLEESGYTVDYFPETTRINSISEPTSSMSAAKSFPPNDSFFVLEYEGYRKNPREVEIKLYNGKTQTLRPEYGWKFHVSVDDKYNGGTNLAIAWDLVKDVLIKYGVQQAKVIRPGKHMTDMTIDNGSTENQAGKQITIYTSGDPRAENPAFWMQIAYEIEYTLKAAGIRPDPNANGNGDFSLLGCQYISYRNDAGFIEEVEIEQTEKAYEEAARNPEILTGIRPQESRDSDLMGFANSSSLNDNLGDDSIDAANPTGFDNPFSHNVETHHKYYSKFYPEPEAEQKSLSRVEEITRMLEQAQTTTWVHVEIKVNEETGEIQTKAPSTYAQLTSTFSQHDNLISEHILYRLIVNEYL